MITIFVNGCFDVLHPGHIALFEYAKSLGEYLIVAIDSDERIKKTKGNSRPIFNQIDRSTMLRSIRHIDEVQIFNDKNELEQLTKAYKPDIMVVGSDWRGKEIVGSQYAKRVEFFSRIGDYSTTKTIQDSPDW